MARVSARGTIRWAGKWTGSGRMLPVLSTQKRATSEARNATQMTRRYCMKATSRGSPPWASAISIMALARARR